MAKNIVLAGEHKGKTLIHIKETVHVGTGIFKTKPLDKSTVKAYEVVDQEHQKSSMDAMGRAVVGSAFLGNAGLLAGVGAKTKGTHTVVIEWHDGEKSLIEINDKLYKFLVADLF